MNLYFLTNKKNFLSSFVIEIITGQFQLSVEIFFLSSNVRLCLKENMEITENYEKYLCSLHLMAGKFHID